MAHSSRPATWSSPPLLQAYWRFVRSESSLLIYGVSLTFLASVGQTFLVFLFVPHFVAEFSSSGAGFGTLYALWSHPGVPLLQDSGGLFTLRGFFRHLSFSRE